MRSTIDKAGRVVIPASIRERAGLRPGTPLEVTADEPASESSAWRHFVAALRHGLRVETPSEFLADANRRG